MDWVNAYDLVENEKTPITVWCWRIIKQYGLVENKDFIKVVDISPQGKRRFFYFFSKEVGETIKQKREVKKALKQKRETIKQKREAKKALKQKELPPLRFNALREEAEKRIATKRIEK